jgi:pimeloyl-ACP methyl ester carboxylesterase
MNCLGVPQPLRVLLALLAAVALLPSCSRAGGDDKRSAVSLTLEPCRAAGILARCGTLPVPEQRGGNAQPGGRTIPLAITVLPAISGEPKPDPVFFLAGGPGQAATDLAAFVIRSLGNLRYERDLVLIDQRGTGNSNGFNCQLGDSENLAERFRVDFAEDELKRCLAEFEGDPTAYTTDATVADLEAARIALGYGPVNLVGVSYGTRLGLVYARNHPESIRAMVLDGVAPPTLRLFLDFLPDAQRALNRTFEACESQPFCQNAFPALRGDFDRLLARLAVKPEQVRVLHPRTGEPFEFELTRDAFATNIRGLLYSAELARLLPYTVSEAVAGNFSPFVAEIELLASSAEEAMSVGLLLSIACAEDVPFFTDREVLELGGKSFVGTAMVDNIKRACEIWNVPSADGSFREPVTSLVPTLLLSGEVDPATPPRWGEQTASTLAMSGHVVVPGASHGTLGVDCVQRIVERFLVARNPRDLDVGCLRALQRPPFFLNALGALPR